MSNANTKPNGVTRTILKKSIVLLTVFAILCSLVCCNLAYSAVPKNTEVPSYIFFPDVLTAVPSTAPYVLEQCYSLPEELIGQYEHHSIIFDFDSFDKELPSTLPHGAQPFEVSFVLPAGCYIGDAPHRMPAFLRAFTGIPCVRSVAWIYQGDDCIGALGFDIYTIPKGMRDDDPAAVYYNISRGNYHFCINDDDYHAVPNENADNISAFCPVYYSSSFNNTYFGLNQEHRQSGVVSYDPNRMVYVAFEFNPSVDTEAIEIITASIRIF